MNNNIYITAHNVAENTKLNHEIAEELRKYTPASLENKGSKFSSKLALNRKRMGLNKTVCLLTLFTLLPPLAQAETCTPTPDCKSLGYTETSCPDGGGVKCPWNTSLMYCCKKCEDKPQTGLVGDFYYCEGQVVGIKVPGLSFAIAMNDASSTMNQNSANSYCTGYRFCGTGTMGRLPTNEELSAIHSNITYLQEQLQKNGGTPFFSNRYWSSSLANGNSEYWCVNPVSGVASHNSYSNKDKYVRPVLGL